MSAPTVLFVPSMQLETATADVQRLLPETLEGQLRRTAGRVVGAVILLVVAALWVALLSWSVSDPSLTHATGGAARNWAGPLGAVASDLMLQMLGLGAAFALLVPMFWALELVASADPVRLRGKLLLYPLAVLTLSGALSALWTPASWPLHHGFGGIVGDLVYSLAANLLSFLNPKRSGAVAGLLLFGGGAALLARSLGQSLGDLLQAVRRSTRRPRRDRYADAPDMPPPVVRRPAPTVSDWRDEPRFERAPPLSPEPVLPMHASNAASATPFAPQPDWVDEPEAPIHDHAAPARAPRGGAFDASTDVDSLAIARRFAPAGSEPARSTPAAAAPPQAAGDRKTGFLGGLMRRQPQQASYRKPNVNLLKRPAASAAGPEFTQTVLRGNARLLEDVLADFGVKGAIKEIHPGPVVTLFELEPARGTKSARVIGLADDIARSMSASSTRVAVVPGRNAIGIELPNVRREPVLLREVLEADAYRNANATLPLALGKSISGEPVVVDLARMPHLLVAGTTGSGKSVGVNAMVLSLLYRVTPEECRFLMIDPKMLELSVYNGIPHLLCPVVTEPQKAVAALNWVVAEMEERYKRMSKLAVRNIDVYNNRVRNAAKRGEPLARTVQTGFDADTGQAVYEQEEMSLEPMPYIVVVVDEFADLMIVAGKEIEAAVQRLAQMARAAGIHLIMATQRPSVDIITGTIKANFPTRISFKVASRIDSRTILNEQGAEQLLGQGDMLFSNGGRPGRACPRRLRRRRRGRDGRARARRAGRAALHRRHHRRTAIRRRSCRFRRRARR